MGGFLLGCVLGGACECICVDVCVCYGCVCERVGFGDMVLGVGYWGVGGGVCLMCAWVCVCVSVYIYKLMRAKGNQECENTRAKIQVGKIQEHGSANAKTLFDIFMGILKSENKI